MTPNVSVHESSPKLVESIHGSCLPRGLRLRRLPFDLQFPLQRLTELWKVAVPHHLTQAWFDIHERRCQPTVALARVLPVIDNTSAVVSADTGSAPMRGNA